MYVTEACSVEYYVHARRTTATSRSGKLGVVSQPPASDGRDDGDTSRHVIIKTKTVYIY